MQVTITATNDQLATAEKMHAMNEALLARTLVNAIQGKNISAQEQYIRDWFKSVRHMAIATQAMAGISMTVKE